MKTKRYSIKVTPDTAAAVRRKAQDDLCPQEPIFSLCAKTVQDRLDAILKDERIDQFEAPGLFADIPPFSPNIKLVATALADDRDGRSQALQTLDLAEIILTNMLGMTIAIRHEMREDETSYFNFISLENLWGMSPYLLGRPASALRLEAVTQLVSELQDHQIGINMLRSGIANGYFPENNQFVQKFLSGPFKNTFNEAGPFKVISVVRGLVNLANQFECDEVAVMTAHLFEDLIGKDAMKSMLPERSVEFWEMHGRRFSNAALSLPQLLALASGQVIGEVIFKSVVARNAALGMIVRMGSARIVLPGYAIFEGATGFGWRLPRLVKAAMNFCGELAKFNAYYMIASGIGGRTSGDIVGMVYMGAIGLTSGYVNQWMRGLLAELRSGQQNGYLAWHLLEDRLGPMAQANLSRELALADTPKTFQLASDASARKILGEISELQLKIEATQLQMAREAAERAIIAEREAARLAVEAQAAAARERALAQRAAKQAARLEILKEKLGVRVAEAEAFAAQMPDDLRATFSEGVRRIAEKPDLNAALTELRTLMGETKKAIAPSSHPTNRSRSTPRPKPVDSPKGLAPRDVRIAEYRPTQTELEVDVAAKPAPAPVPAVTETSTVGIERLIKHPPRELDVDTLMSITLDRVVFDRSMLKEIQETYRSVPTIRGRLLRRLAEISGRLGDTGNKNWTILMDKDAPACMRGKVGDQYRIMAQRMPDGRWNVYNLEVRGQLKPHSDAWLPK